MLVLVLVVVVSNIVSIWLSDWSQLLPTWQATIVKTFLDIALAVPLLYFFGLRSLIRENTQRTRAEAALRESEEKYRRLFDSSKDAFMTLTPPDWRFTSGNPSTVAMFRARDEAEFTSKAPWKLSPERQPDGRLSAEKAKAMIEQALREGHHYFEWTHKRLDGEEFPATVLLTRLELKGRILLNASVRDITERKHDENRLRLFRALLDQSTDAIVVVNPATARIMDVNESACVNLGYTREELLALRVMDIGATSISDFAAFERNTKQLKAAGALRFESEQRRKDGYTFPVEVSLRYISRPEGDYALAITRDITERKQVETALRWSEAQLLVILDSTADGILAVDGQGKIIKTNRRFVELWQIPPSLLEKHDDQALLAFVLNQLSEPEAFLKKVQALYGSDAVDLDTITFKDGRFFDRASAPILMAGVVSGRVWSFRDITERKRAEQERQRLVTLVENSPDFTGLAALDGKVSDLNPAGRRLVGLRTEEELKGKTVFDFVAAEDLQRFQTEILAAVRQTGRWQGEFQLRDFQTGRPVQVEMDTFMVFDPETGQPAGLATICRDLTEKKALERQFLRTQRLENLGTLASGIAHDLNNILAPIMMSAQLLQLKGPDEEDANILATIVGSANRGANIVKQVLTFARGVEGERVPVQPKYLVKEMEKIFRETFPKNITFRSEAPKGLWSVTGDATQLHQVLMNLCVNARDAMPEGGTLILSAENVQVRKARSGLFANAKPGPHLLIRVSDTGEGIPPAIIERIFEPFFTTKELGKGTGLGLSTVLGIVRSHGGFVDVESEPGRGSTFKVYLPAQPAEETQHLQRAPAASLRGAGEWILVVDDEANIRDMTRATVTKHGYEVLVAANGKEALDLLSARADQLKAVITDIMMPVMDGVALVRTMKQSYPQIPVIVCTGWGQEGLRAQLRELGVKTFLEKPYEAAKLLAALHEHLTATL